MPKVGDKEFPYTPEGMAAAKAESQNMGIPVNDGANRSVTEYAGGGKTGYSSIGMQRPMMGHGGKMEPTRGMKPMGKKAKKTSQAKDVTDKVPQNPKDKGVTDPAKKYEEGGKAHDDAIKKMKKETKDVKGVKTEHKTEKTDKGIKKTSKRVVNVGSISGGAEAEKKLLSDMKKIKDKAKSETPKSFKAKQDSLKKVAKDKENSLKKDLKKDTHDSDMAKMRAKLKAAGM